MRSLFFIGRHGETFLNESGKYRGWSNGPDAMLNEDGIKSAHDAAKFLIGLKQGFKKIICSPLDRAQLTAAICAEYLGITELEIDERLRPLNVGDLAGELKKDHPVTPYLHDKSKRFPGGETVYEFEARQNEFGMYLLNLVEQKVDDDSEILVIAHVSNVMYWHNVQTGKNSEEYLGETTDIILPGGVAVVTEHSTLPLFKENLMAEPDVLEDKLDQYKAGYQPARVVDSKVGTKCGECWKFVKSGKCVEVSGPISAEQSCIQYVKGTPFASDPRLPILQLAPEMVGLGPGNTNCGKCEYFGGTDLCKKVRGYDGVSNEHHIEEGGCCNSFEERK